MPCSAVPAHGRVAGEHATTFCHVSVFILIGIPADDPVTKQGSRGTAEHTDRLLHAAITSPLTHNSGRFARTSASANCGGTSGFLWWRKHIHLVDEILLRAPQLRAVSEGFFIVTTTVSGFTTDVLRAEMIVEGMGYKVMNAEMIHNSCMEADK